MKHTRLFFRIFAQMALGAALILASLRQYLFGNGLFVYRDWSWPLSTQIAPTGLFSPGVLRNSFPDISGFTRIFLTWPVVLIDRTTDSPILAEKAFVIYLFAMILFLSIVLAEILLRLLDSYSNSPLGQTKSVIFECFVVVFSLANIWSLQALSDLYYTFVVQMLLLSIVLSLIILMKNSFKTILLTGAFLSLSVFLDPDLLLYELTAVAVTVLITSLKVSLSLRSLVQSISKIACILVVTLPSLVTSLYGLSTTAGTNLRPIGSNLQFASNLSLANSIRLLGYWWSSITFSPPSLLQSNIPLSSLPYVGSPPFMLLPPGGISTFWLVTTWTVPVFAFSSFFIKRFRTITGPAVLVAAVGLFMNQNPMLIFANLLAEHSMNIPLVGGALATAIAIPDHVLIIVATAYVILIATGIYWLVSLVQFHHAEPHALSGKARGFKTLVSSHRKSLMRSLVVLSVIFFLTFPSWQFFSGSFYPSGYGGIGFSGNGIPNVGSYSPSTPPDNLVQTYQWLLSQPGNFNIYWPGPSVVPYPWTQKATPPLTVVDSPKPTYSVYSATPFVARFTYLISSQLTEDIGPYLAALNVKYLIVQNLSSSDLLLDWGIGNLGLLRDVLGNSSGISLAFTDGDICVYEVQDTLGSLYTPNVILEYNGGDQLYTVAYAILPSLGLHPAFIDGSSTANQLCFDNLHCSVAILSPSYLSQYTTPSLMFDTLQNPPYNQSAQVLMQSGTYYIGNSTNTWLVANWGPGNSTVAVDQGTMKWSFSNLSTFQSLSYECTGINGVPCGVEVPPNYSAKAEVSLLYRTSDNFNGTVQIAISALNGSLRNIAYPVSDSSFSSSQWHVANFTVTLPKGTAYFTPRIGATASSGWVEMKNVSLSVSFLENDNYAPFGYVLPPVVNSSESLGVINGSVFLQYTGSGTVYMGNQTISLSKSSVLTWAHLSVESPATLSVVGNVNISSIVAMDSAALNAISQGNITVTGGGISFDSNSTQSVIYARYFVPGYTLGSGGSYHSYSTLDGLNLFLNVTAGKYSVTYSPLAELQFAYSLSLALDGVIFVNFLLSRSQRQKCISVLKTIGTKVTLWLRHAGAVGVRTLKKERDST